MPTGCNGPPWVVRGADIAAAAAGCTLPSVADRCAIPVQAGPPWSANCLAEARVGPLAAPAESRVEDSAVPPGPGLQLLVLPLLNSCWVFAFFCIHFHDAG